MPAQASSAHAASGSWCDAGLTFAKLQTRLNATKGVERQIVESNPCLGIKPYPLKKRTRHLTDAKYAGI